jgi:hypothetical protein
MIYQAHDANSLLLTDHKRVFGSSAPSMTGVSSLRSFKDYGASGVRMLPAGEVEGAVLAQLRANLRSPDMAAMVWQEVQKLGESMTEIEVSVALNRIDEIWEQLFPAEQARVVRVLVERVTVTPSELHVKMRPNGFERMALEIGREMQVEECVAA